MRVRDIMTREVVMVCSTVSVTDAVAIMIEKNVSSLIVNREDESDTYGIVTRRDVVNKIVSEGLHPREIKVSDIMTKPIITIHPDLSIKNAARMMTHTGVRRMPVFDGHHIIGILSNSDIFRGYNAYLNEEESFIG